MFRKNGKEDKGTAMTEEASDTTTTTTTTASDDAGGFEFLPEVPHPASSGGKSKYDWAAFPKPSPGRFPAKTYPMKHPTSLRKSIKKFLDEQRKAGIAEADLPQFSLSAVKGDDGTVQAFKAIRTK